MYKTYLDLFQMDPKDPEKLSFFFYLMSYRYSASTMWTIFSTINAWYVDKNLGDIKMWPRVTKQMKAITKNYVPTKAPVFTQEDMAKIFEHLETRIEAGGWDGKKARSIYVGITTAYYGLCRVDDLMKITTNDYHRIVKPDGTVSYMVRYEAKVYSADNSDDDINPTEKRKHTVEPFEFDLPARATKHIDDMIRLTLHNKRDRRMIKNAAKNSDTNVYTQNMGRKAIALWARDLAKWLNKKDWALFTGHTWRRTGAIILADHGAGEVALKRAGQWKSMTTAMSYVQRSSVARHAQQKLLSTELNRPVKKLKNLEENPPKKEEPALPVVTKTKPINDPNNDVRVIDNFKGDNSTVNLTTNIIITTTTPAKMVGSLIASGGVAQKVEKKSDA